VLRQVPDFDGASEPDQIVQVELGGSLLFMLHRREMDLDTLSEVLGEEVAFPYSVFHELWNRAQLSNDRVTEHLKTLNSILKKDLARS
jgi:hypothetical protein